jgi:hypothetical protein
MRSSSSKIFFLLLALGCFLGFGYFCAVRTVDFRAYYAAGERLLRGDLDLYQIDSVRRALTFRYAPFIALLFVPFALLPLPAGAFLWFLLKVGALGIIPLLALKLSGSEQDAGTDAPTNVPAPPALKVFGLSFLLAGGYIVEEFRIGNAHFLTLFLVVLSFYLIQRGRTLLPSLLLAAAIAAKITPILFLFYYGLKKKYTVCGLTLLALLVMLLFPALPFGWETNVKWLSDWGRSVSSRLEEPVNHSLRGFLFRYLTGNEFENPKYPKVNLLDLSGSAITILWLVLSLSLLFLLGRIVLKGGGGNRTALLECALVLTAVLLLSPHATRIYFSSLFFPYCALVILLNGMPESPWRTTLKTVLWVSFALNTLLPAALPGRTLSLGYEALSPYFFSAALLFFTLYAALSRMTRTR